MADIKAISYESMRAALAWLNGQINARWNNDPFGLVPRGTREEYLGLFESTRRKEYPLIDAFERELGYALDRGWLEDLALHTQIVKKQSELAYPHGRLLYSLLRQYIAKSGEGFVSILETGTARGFSALCMARAIEDAGIDGRIITIDVLPHLKMQYWNCIDDCDGKKTRAELLAPWSSMLNRVLFLQGDTVSLAPMVGLDRIHFAFLDAQHIKMSVLAEFDVVSRRQKPGDIIVFDDVTPFVFPGVVHAVNEVERRGEYEVSRLTLSDQRAYAWAVRR